MTMPHREANRLLKQNAQWSEYLLDSQYYPSFETDHGVHVRKFAWELNFAIVELWGHCESLAAVAVDLAIKGHEEGMKIDAEKKEKENAAGEKDGSPKAKADDAGEKKEKDGNCHVRLLVYDSEVHKFEKDMPTAQISRQPIIPHPLNCHSLTIEASPEEATDAVKKFIKHMADYVAASPAVEVKEPKPWESKGKGAAQWQGYAAPFAAPSPTYAVPYGGHYAAGYNQYSKGYGNQYGKGWDASYGKGYDGGYGKSWDNSYGRGYESKPSKGGSKGKKGKSQGKGHDKENESKGKDSNKGGSSKKGGSSGEVANSGGGGSKWKVKA
jgi:hypothetical protein